MLSFSIWLDHGSFKLISYVLVFFFESWENSWTTRLHKIFNCNVRTSMLLYFVDSLYKRVLKKSTPSIIARYLIVSQTKSQISRQSCLCTAEHIFVIITRREANKMCTNTLQFYFNYESVHNGLRYTWTW